MPTTISALSLPFDAAIQYLAAKTNATSTHWTDVWQAANAKAFTVAGAATQALVQDFRTEVAKALEQGTTLAEFRKSFDAIVKKHGWQHTGTPGWRARIIYQTNLAMAYSAGRYAQATEPETLAQYPYWQYVHSGALHPRLQHLSWNGLVLRADDSWWTTHYPPNGWHCGCRVRVLSARDLGRQGKSGPDQAPPVEYVPWKNPKTGEVKQVVKGIDPSFDYNPGQTWKSTPVSIPPNATLQVPPIPGLPGIGKPKPPPKPTSAEPPSTRPGPSAPGWLGRLMPRSGATAGPGPKPSPPTKTAPSQPVRAETAPGRDWPWAYIEPRVLQRFDLDDRALAAGRSLGLFSDAADARRFVGRIMAGVPAEEDLYAAVSLEDDVLKVRGASKFANVVRSFEREIGDPTKVKVHHDLFTLDDSYQHGGQSKAMMRASIEEYIQRGVSRIEVHANIDVGGYAWARRGFRLKFPARQRRSFDLHLSLESDRFSGAEQAILQNIIDTASDADLVYELARAKSAEGRLIGKDFLLWSDWVGEIDLTDQTMIARLKESLL